MSEMRGNTGFAGLDKMEPKSCDVTKGMGLQIRMLN